MKTAGRIAVALASVLLCLAAAEIALRLSDPPRTEPSLRHRVPHPVLGWSLDPGASYLTGPRRRPIRVTYNEQGWRDVPHAFEKPEGVFRIVVLGDSYMEAYSVALEDSFARRLEALAVAGGRRVEVINLGVGGFGTLQEYLAWRDWGRRYEPDLVLLGFYPTNDVRNNSLALESIVSEGSIKVESRPFLDESESTWQITSIDYDGARERFAAGRARVDEKRRRLAVRSALLRRVRAAIGGRARTPSGDADRMPDDDDAERDAARSFLASYGVGYCVETSEYTAAWRTTARILERLKREVESEGSRLLVFSVPARHDVSVPHMKRVRSLASEFADVCLEEGRAYVRLAGILDELGIPSIDLLGGFRHTSHERGIELFHGLDRHWNAAGHALAARSVLGELDRRGWLPADSGG